MNSVGCPLHGCASLQVFCPWTSSKGLFSGTIAET
jgi:hypothetical protein